MRRTPLAFSSRSFLSLSEICGSVRSHHDSADRQRSRGKLLAGAGVQLQLPPFTVWGADRLSHEALCGCVDEYVSAAALAQPSPPPLFLSLRLFPDSSLVTAADTSSRPPITQAPLAAFEAPWDPVMDARDVFRHALAGLQTLAELLLPRLPAVLVLPTRLLVSQHFLSRMASVLERAGWRSVAFELPSTALLYQAPHRPRGESSADHCRCWCRLPLLAHDWASVRRIGPLDEAAGAALSQHTVLPLHTLLPWSLEQGLWDAFDCGLTVDTVPPPRALRRNFALGCGQEVIPTGKDEDDEEALHAPSAGRVVEGVPDAIYRAVRSKGSVTVDKRTDTLKDLDLASALAQAQQNRGGRRRATAPPEEQGQGDGAGLLTLSAPPDALKQLILQSITSSSTGDGGTTGAEPQNCGKTAVSPSGIDFSWFQEQLRAEMPDASEEEGNTHNEEGRVAGLQDKLDEGDTMFPTGDDTPPLPLDVRDDAFGAEYWSTLDRLEAKLRSRFTFTMPTLHASQVAAWSTARTRASDTRKQPNLLIPVVYPLLSPAKLSVQRRLRGEGPRDEAAEAEDNARWLPRRLERALDDTLSQASSSFSYDAASGGGDRGGASCHPQQDAQTLALAEVLVSYRQHLRDGGGKENRGGTNESAPDDGQPRDDSDDGAGGNIRLRSHDPRTRPFWYKHPDHFLVQRRGRRRRPSSALLPGGNTLPLRRESGDTDEEAFKQREVGRSLTEVAQEAGEDGFVCVAVPVPGVRDDELRDAWRLLV